MDINNRISSLENKLSVIKIMINSNYGSGTNNPVKTYDDTIHIKEEISFLKKQKLRMDKINKIKKLNGIRKNK